jgi:prepilin-type N-terminal cleavage/methylation domain-containing protein
MKMKSKQGFTLVEIMIVVAIIGLLAAIAIPSFMRARQNTQTNTCINNLRLIDGAKDQWSLESGVAVGAAVAEADIAGYLKNGVPTCPIGAAAYTIDVIGTDPSCPNYNVTTHPSVLP